MADTKLNLILGGRRVQVYTYHDISNGNMWNQQVYLPFKPRQCVVRQVVFSVDPERDTEVYLLRGISLDNSVLAMIPAVNIPVESSVVIDTSDKHIGATLRFQLQDLDGSATTSNTGEIACVLEFVE